MEKKRTVLVVGGGASGMMAAIAAAEQGAEVTLLEKNAQLGKKILITGKGRCNVTNDKDVQQLISSFPHNGKFLYAALNTFDNQQTKAFFEMAGVPLKVERGERVFPVSDQAKDIVVALTQKLKMVGVRVEKQRAVASLIMENQSVVGVRLTSGEKRYADRIIIATGGASYAGTGSTGDGYEWAKAVGHTIVPLRPALIPLESSEGWLKNLQGLSLKNVRLTLFDANQKKIAEDFGEMIFTHFGISGPIVLTVSGQAVDYWQQNKKALTAVIDFKPALTAEQLDARLLREIEAQHNKHYKNSLGTLMPQKLVSTFISRSGIAEDKVMHQLTKEERHKIVALLKNFTFMLHKARPLNEAIVTAGGVATKEVSPQTMASKLVDHLYFTGEILDIDGITGGFNLQAAFSTGYLAGLSCAQEAGY